jgi:hypothetical protein
VALEPPPGIGVEVVVDPTNGQVFQALESVDELPRPELTSSNDGDVTRHAQVLAPL